MDHCHQNSEYYGHNPCYKKEVRQFAVMTESVAEEMIKDCLSRPWLANATTKKGSMPTVIVGTVRNQSSEHIATDTFTEDLQRELLNSGKVEFVASKGERRFKPASAEMSSFSRCRITTQMTVNAAMTVNK